MKTNLTKYTFTTQKITTSGQPKVIKNHFTDQFPQTYWFVQYGLQDRDENIWLAQELQACVDKTVKHLLTLQNRLFFLNKYQDVKQVLIAVIGIGAERIETKHLL